jgi:methionyl-tRNA formyltransferase
MGTPRAAVPSLDRLLRDGHEIVAVYVQPDKPSGRGKKVTFTPVKEYALGRSLPVLQPAKIRNDETIDQFRAHDADAAIVVAYGRILPEDLLNAFPHGAINVHFSLLPKYRGAAPVNWAIVSGESETGVTTMQMDAGLDTGPILLQRTTAIQPDETAIELTERLSLMGADVLSETLTSFNNIVRRPQDDKDVSFAPVLKREDGLVDWNMPAGEIANRVRGFQPFPTAYTYRNRLRLTIWKARSIEGSANGRSVGEVVASKSDALLISCGDDSCLKIEELQMEGKKRMPARDFLNGVHIDVGEIIGR